MGIIKLGSKQDIPVRGSTLPSSIYLYLRACCVSVFETKKRVECTPSHLGHKFASDEQHLKFNVTLFLKNKMIN